MRTRQACLGILAVVAIVPLTVAAQTPTPPKRTDVEAAYDSGGRRDPFVSLIGNGPKKDPAGAAVRRVTPGAGLASLMVTEVSLKGILQGSAAAVAILEGPDGRTFIAKRQDRLLNGSIKSIEKDAVVFAEIVDEGQNGPRTREVRRLLHPPVGGGGR
jgi:Tfp pilus assembly protein PilP